MASTETVILGKEEIAHKLKRIAYQIYEANISQEEVVIAGIKANGYIFAEKLKTAVEKISPIKVTLCKVTMDKKKSYQTYYHISKTRSLSK